MNWEQWLAVGSFAVVIFGLLYNYFGVVVKQIAEREKLGNRILTLEGKLSSVDPIQMLTDLIELKTKMTLFWDAMGNVAKDIIKQPIHYRIDDLLDRFNTLSADELCELKGILEIQKVELIKAKDQRAFSYAFKIFQIDVFLLDIKKACRG